MLPTTPVRDFSRSPTLRDAVIYDLVATRVDGCHGEMGFERSLARTYFEAVDKTDLGLGTPLPADFVKKTAHKKGRFFSMVCKVQIVVPQDKFPKHLV